MKSKTALFFICLLISSCTNLNEKVNTKLNIINDYKNGTLENNLVIPPYYDQRPALEKTSQKEKIDFFDKEYLTE